MNQCLNHEKSVHPFYLKKMSRRLICLKISQPSQLSHRLTNRLIFLHSVIMSYNFVNFCYLTVSFYHSSHPSQSVSSIWTTSKSHLLISLILLNLLAIFSHVPVSFFSTGRPFLLSHLPVSFFQIVSSFPACLVYLNYLKVAFAHFSHPSQPSRHI